MIVLLNAAHCAFVGNRGSPGKLRHNEGPSRIKPGAPNDDALSESNTNAMKGAVDIVRRLVAQGQNARCKLLQPFDDPPGSGPLYIGGRSRGCIMTHTRETKFPSPRPGSDSVGVVCQFKRSKAISPRTMFPAFQASSAARPENPMNKPHRMVLVGPDNALERQSPLSRQ